MDDDTQAKCRVIAEWEGVTVDGDICKGCFFTSQETREVLHNAKWNEKAHAHLHQDHRIEFTYPHDLNATMRAARRLSDGCFLETTSTGRASIYDESDTELVKTFVEDDPARAAFECLYEFVAAQRKEKI